MYVSESFSLVVKWDTASLALLGIFILNQKIEVNKFPELKFP